MEQKIKIKMISAVILLAALVLGAGCSKDAVEPPKPAKRKPGITICGISRGYYDSKIITKADIISKLCGEVLSDEVKSRFTIKKIFIPTIYAGNAAVIGKVPNLQIQIKAMEDFSAEITLSHPSFLDVTATMAVSVGKYGGQKSGLSFEWVNACDSKITSAGILAKLRPLSKAKGYQIKSIKEVIEKGESSEVSITGTAPNFVLTLRKRKLGWGEHWRSVRLEIVLEKKGNYDVILYCSIRSQPYFREFHLWLDHTESRVVTTSKIFLGIRCYPKGSVLKSIKINDKYKGVARVVGTAPNLQIELLRMGYCEMDVTLSYPPCDKAITIKGKVYYGIERKEGAFRHLIQTADGGYAMFDLYNRYDDDIRMLKLDKNGKKQWLKTIIEPDFYRTVNFQPLLQTSDGGYAILGHKEGGYPQDILLLKVDANGNKQSSKTLYSTSWKESIHKIIQTKDGGYAIAGRKSAEDKKKDWDVLWLVKLDALGKKQWEKTFAETYNDYKPLGGVVQTSDGGYVLMGSKMNDPEDYRDSDFLVVKTDKLGNTLWQRTFEYNDDSSIVDIIATADGGCALLGYEDYRKLIMIKINEKGIKEWDKRFSEKAIEGGLVQTSDGGYTVAYNDDSKHTFVNKLDGVGNLKWKKKLSLEVDSFSSFAFVKTKDEGYAILVYMRIPWRNIFFKLDKDGNVEF